MQNDTLYNFKAYPFNKTKLHEIDTVFTLYYYIVNKNRNRLLLILLSKTTG